MVDDSQGATFTLSGHLGAMQGTDFVKKEPLGGKHLRTFFFSFFVLLFAAMGQHKGNILFHIFISRAEMT